MAARHLLMAALLALSGCGFEPLYGDSGSATQADLSRVRIAAIQDAPDPFGRNAPVARGAQELRNFLLDRVTPRGGARAPLYELRVSLTEAKSVLGIRSDESATRATLNLAAGFSLVRLDNNQVMLQSSARSEVSYNILRNEFATISVESDARRRGARELSEAIAHQVANALGAAKEGVR
jgi:LPS-assembly lipoprotein